MIALLFYNRIFVWLKLLSAAQAKVEPGLWLASRFKSITKIPKGLVLVYQIFAGCASFYAC